MTPILRKGLILIGKSKNSSAKKLTVPKVKKRRENLLILILIAESKKSEQNLDLDQWMAAGY